jgi:hypothetical protein
MRRRISSVIAAAALLALSAQAVSADALLADGDGLAPLAGGRMNLGRICHGETTTRTALIAVRATGHPNNRNVFDNGTTVTTTATILSGTNLSATSTAPSLVMAADWRSQPNQSLSAAAPWDVSVTPDALGQYRGRIEFIADGLNRNGQPVSRVARMNVVARVVDCAAPVLAGLPTDFEVEATAADGADVAYVPPTATDAVDGPVAVDCDVPASGRLPLGLTTVTCTASDRAGYEVIASFAITVADRTAPALDGVPSDVAMEASGPDGGVADWPAPTATDTVDGAVAVTCDPAAGSTFAIGTTTVTCSATDAAGNVTTAVFTVEVSAPAVELPVGDPEDPVDEPEEPVPSDEPVDGPDARVDEGTADGNPPVAPSADGPAAAPVQPTGDVLPDTSMAPVAGSLMPIIGMALVALTAATAGRRRGR